MEELISDPEERWIVERGLQLSAQNALDDFSVFARHVESYLASPDTE